MISQEEALARAAALMNARSGHERNRTRVRAIMDGGNEALKVLLGPKIRDEDLPWANLMLSGMTRLGQKIGSLPDVRVDPPVGDDNERPRLRAEKRQRVVDAYDTVDRVEMQLPQVGRWLPGYGFAVWTIGAHRTPEGYVYPKAELRDPYDCWPGEWGVDQQPSELAIVRVMTVEMVKRMFPNVGEKFMSQYQRGSGGGVIMGGAGWENQSGRGVTVVEYYNEEGTHTLIPAAQERVRFVANPLASGPAFVIPKRFAFNKLVGHYDHSIGLMSAMTKINVMAIMAMEDAVQAPTNIYGEPPNPKYRVGRLAVNVMPPGTKVDRPQSNLPYQLFEQVNRMERMFRVVSSYPVTDDAQSPMSFVTGAGLEELQSSVSAEVREYQKVIKYAMQDLDAKRLEWDELVADRKKPLAGLSSRMSKVEKYTPSRDISGDYRTRRQYGMMSGWDDSAKIVGGLQLVSGGIIDRLSMQENIDGLGELSQINERIADDQARQSLMQGLVAASQQGDQRAVFALIEMLPEGPLKTTLKKYYTPDEPQMSPEEQMAINGPQPEAPADITTVLSRLTGQGVDSGVQTISRV